VICTCDQCDSAFCALQLTALIKPDWYVLLYCRSCLHPNTILETGWTTVPCPATNLSILTCKSSPRKKQSVISVALKTHLEIRLGICIYKTSLLHRPDDYIGFTQSCPPTFYNKIAPMVVHVYMINRHWRPLHRKCLIWDYNNNVGLLYVHSNEKLTGPHAGHWLNIAEVGTFPVVVRTHIGVSSSQWSCNKYGLRDGNQRC